MGETCEELGGMFKTFQNISPHCAKVLGRTDSMLVRWIRGRNTAPFFGGSSALLSGLIEAVRVQQGSKWQSFPGP